MVGAIAFFKVPEDCPNLGLIKTDTILFDTLQRCRSLHALRAHPHAPSRTINQLCRSHKTSWQVCEQRNASSNPGPATATATPSPTGSNASSRTIAGKLELQGAQQMGGRELSVPHMQDREEAVADQREQSIGGVAKRV